MIKKILWNIAGPGLPIIIAIYATPKILEGYGPEGFTTLSIIFSLIGYLTIFDFGISKAITKYIAETDIKHARSINRTWFTALIFLLTIGIALSAVVFFGAKPIILKYFNLSKESVDVTIKSLELTSLAIPFTLISVISTGTLEAKGQFFQLNIIRIVSGTLNFLLPVFLLDFNATVYHATASLVALKISTSAILTAQSIAILDFKKLDTIYTFANFKPLLKFSAWVSISGFISPLLTQLDRFILITIIPAKQMPNYVIAADMFNRLSFIPSSFMTVFFPFFVQKNKENGIFSIEIYKTTIASLNLVGIICMLTTALLSEYFLEIWLEKNYTEEMSFIFFIFSIGFYFNCLARIPYTTLQSIDRPDIPAKIHLIEFFIYILLLYYASKQFGVIGAACAWSIRMTADFLAMYFATQKTSQLSSSHNHHIAICINPLLCSFIFKNEISSVISIACLITILIINFFCIKEIVKLIVKFK